MQGPSIFRRSSFERARNRERAATHVGPEHLQGQPGGAVVGNHRLHLPHRAVAWCSSRAGGRGRRGGGREANKLSQSGQQASRRSLPAAGRRAHRQRTASASLLRTLTVFALVKAERPAWHHGGAAHHRSELVQHCQRGGPSEDEEVEHAARHAPAASGHTTGAGGSGQGGGRW